jgi:lysophospholipase L1-like esterase
MTSPKTRVKKTTLRERVLMLLLPVGALLTAFLIAEATFRLAGYGNVVQYRYLPEVGWVHRPNQRAFTVGRKPVHINSLGLRGPELSVRKPGSVFRILLLGDSFTFGYGVGDDSTYGRQLERLFIQEQGDCVKVEVLNAGVNGYNTAQELAYLDRSGLAFEPDVVVLGFTPNDIMTQDEGKTMLRWPGLKQMLARSALYQFAAPRLKALVYQGAGKAYEDTLSLFLRGDTAVETRVESLRARLNDFHRLGAVRHFQPVLVLFPFAQQVYDSGSSTWPPRVITEVASTYRLPLLDLLPAFRDAVYHDETTFLNEPTHHPNGRGQQVAASALYAFLGNRLLVPNCAFHHSHETPVDSRVARAAP